MLYMCNAAYVETLTKHLTNFNEILYCALTMIALPLLLCFAVGTSISAIFLIRARAFRPCTQTSVLMEGHVQIAVSSSSSCLLTTLHCVACDRTPLHESHGASILSFRID